ncbi:inositol 2-dehydrogenase [Rhizobium wenxiniae]|uniref:Myo-inositol 2-dehydrogenase/D-chiro-inositol 1-dehydrogenase n=1 Tax=Rhizobium wenxiniae TaxID=1737357 RepID=A0A7W9YCD7_9HYPH|nr:inositol 2-dehydrogenase [Rhizobium wenxiniae]MBB6165965.1 myo-inositol 2-dehydrogenase/D-chiro-inositol 1-dehydrogenase [Rhizobium wenxiniae]GGG20303.1 inositol 2-dehydrogenase [Rhizobium wenxiniae]
MLKIGLLGAGRIGRVHAINIAGHARSQLVAVSDVNEGAARSLGEAYGAKVASSEAILYDASIDAVLIATSTDTHSDLMEKAAAAGKAILCEKPVDLSLARAQACLDAVSKTGVPVMIGFNRRFDPNFSAIKASIAAGEIGKPELLSITSFDPAPPPVTYVKVSGGLFRDMMIHDFDMANFLMGDVPKTVHAAGTSIVDPEIGKAGDVDTAVVTLTYADGRIAVIKNSRRAVYGYDQRVEILGSEGLLSAGNVLENTVSKATKQGVTSAKPEFFFLERYMRAYAAEWDAFVAAVLDGAAIPVTLKDGVAALALAEAATASVKSGQPVALT